MRDVDCTDVLPRAVFGVRGGVSLYGRRERTFAEDEARLAWQPDKDEEDLSGYDGELCCQPTALSVA